MIKSIEGQISAEFILLMGFILIVVVLVASYVGENSEMNNVMAAAKIATVTASNDLAYNNTGNVIRFNNMTFDDGKITVTVYSHKALTPENKNYIKKKILYSISNILGVNVVDDSVQGKYSYTVIVENTI